MTGPELKTPSLKTPEVAIVAAVAENGVLPVYRQNRPSPGRKFATSYRRSNL